MPAQAAAGSMPERMPGFLARVLENNTGLEALPSLIPFSIEGSRVGAMKPAFVEHVEKFGSDVFVVANGAVTLNPGLDSGSPEERTRAVAGLCLILDKVLAIDQHPFCTQGCFPSFEMLAWSQAGAMSSILSRLGFMMSLRCF